MDNFKWTDDLVREFAIGFIHFESGSKQIEKFKQSKQPKKDYEILEFKHRGDLFVKSYSEYYNSKKYICSLNHIPEKSEIISVKRLSDGEVFTVGEKVVHKTDGHINTATILKFVIPKTSNSIWFEFEQGEDFVKDLNNFNKHKKPLFTTEDGVDIYEGDKYWYADVKESSYPKPIDYEATKGGKYPNNYTSKTFSTKEAAEEWILNNKPLLSLEEISHLYTRYRYSAERFGKELIECAKSKL